MNAHAYREAIRNTIKVLAILFQELAPNEREEWVEYLRYLGELDGYKMASEDVAMLHGLDEDPGKTYYDWDGVLPQEGQSGER